MKVVAVILAAGGSTRLGRPKQLVTYEGEPLVARAARIARASTAVAVAAVIGANAVLVEEALAETGVTTIVNESWESGMGSSVRAAVRHATAHPASGLLLVLCDQPLLTTAHLDRLIAAFDGRTVGSAYGGSIGVPAIFERERWPELLLLSGDRGAKALLRGAEAIDWPEGAVDCDTEEDLARLTV